MFYVSKMKSNADRNLRSKCTFHADFINREQSVFFRFELLFLEVNILDFSGL